MRKFGIFVLILLCMISCCTLPSNAQQTPSVSSSCSTLRAGHALNTDPYTGTADAAILYELETQTLVYAHNPDAIINPTGLVKIMTALIALEEGNLDDVVTVNRSTLNALTAGAKRVGLVADEQMTLRDLLYCVMVSSANDAAAVIAEHIAGSQYAFVEKMNARAATLGCTQTHFANPHGLQDEMQKSTAREMGIITAEAIKNETFREMFAVVNYQLPATNQSEARMLSTTNSMMDPSSKKYYDERVTGGKPAAASTADRSMICTAEGENGRYLCVVISATAKTSGYSVTEYTNFLEAKKLLDLGLKGFAVQQVLGAAQPFDMYEVRDGENSVVVGADRDVYALLPIQYDQSMLRLQAVKKDDKLVAPVSSGTVVASLQICYGNIVVTEVDLLARHDVAVKGSSVQNVERSEKNKTLQTVKWVVIAIFALAILVAAGLVVLRQINLNRYRKKKQQRSRQEEP